MEENNLPPGFRFHPTDEELITFYLSEKVSDSGFAPKAIADVDLNKCEPWDLPAKASMGEKEWYFFSLRDRKYPTGLRTNRATVAGYWKTTGKDKEIFREERIIGMKKTLVFYRGRAPKGEKTNWVMHEYRLHTKVSFRPIKEEWVVCRVFQKSAIVKMPQPSSPLQQYSQGSPDDTNPNGSEFGDIELPCMSALSNSSNGFGYPSLENYLNNNGHLSTNLNLNWVRDMSSLPTSSWPSGLLTPNLNSTVNSLLLKALQLRSTSIYQPAGEATAHNYSFLGQGLPFGTDLSSNNFPSSSSNEVLESMPQQQQQQQQQPQQLLQEQPFNMDSMW